MKWWNSPLPYAVLFVLLMLGVFGSCSIMASSCASHGGNWDGGSGNCTMEEKR